MTRTDVRHLPFIHICDPINLWPKPITADFLSAQTILPMRQCGKVRESTEKQKQKFKDNPHKLEAE